MKFRSSIKSKLVASIVLFIIGFVFSAVAVGLNINDKIKKDSWDEVEAVIIHVNHNTEFAELSYSYNGDVLFVGSNSYSSTYEVGDIMIIYVNPNNPNDFYEASTSSVFIVFYCVGAVMLLIGIGLYASHVKTQKKIKRCMEEGSIKTVDVFELYMTHFYCNHQPYYVLKARYNGKEYKSHMFLLPKSFTLNTKTVVNLYIIDDENYYIDLSSVREIDNLE